MTTTIQKWGNSQGIRVPKHILQSINLSDNETVELFTENDTIIIKKLATKKPITIEDLFANYDGEYKTSEYDWGKPMGREIW